MSLARRLRVQAARTRGIRIVPENPSPADFPFVPHACDLRPFRCDRCNMHCPLGVR